MGSLWFQYLWEILLAAPIHNIPTYSFRYSNYSVCSFVQSTPVAYSQSLLCGSITHTMNELVGAHYSFEWSNGYHLTLWSKFHLFWKWGQTFWLHDLLMINLRYDSLVQGVCSWSACFGECRLLHCLAGLKLILFFFLTGKAWVRSAQPPWLS